MKRTLIIMSVLILFSISLCAGGRTALSLSGNLVFPSDGNFKDIYGKSVFYPELLLSFKVVKDFYIWAGFGFMSVSGETSTLKLEATSTQTFVSLGGGYQGKISDQFSYFLELGLFYVSYKEEALETEVSDSAMGFCVNGRLVHFFGRKFFAGICAGYQGASDEVDSVSIKLGGMKAGICLGVVF